MTTFLPAALLVTLLGGPIPAPTPPAHASVLRDAIARQACVGFVPTTHFHSALDSRRPVAPDPAVLKIAAGIAGGVVGGTLGGLAGLPAGSRGAKIGLAGGAAVGAWAIVRRVSRRAQ